jgi:hypothetical protein
MLLLVCVARVLRGVLVSWLPLSVAVDRSLGSGEADFLC